MAAILDLRLEGNLVEAVHSGRAVLFLGSGASLGAKDEHGSSIPSAPELARDIAHEFLGDEYSGYDFKAVCDLAASHRDARTLQEYLYRRLYPFRPADFHLLIPAFNWAGLLTTNYDLVVERAYELAPHPLQKLVPYVKDAPGVTDLLHPNSVLYIKLHGCITHYQDVDPPLLASTEQLIRHRSGRVGQFDTFLEWAKTKTIVFVGYSFMDSNLRTLFDEVIKDGDKRPRHYIVNPGLKPLEHAYWSERRVRPIDLSFSDFMTQLDGLIPDTSRPLSVLAIQFRATTFTRFITAYGRTETSELRAYLSTSCEHVSVELEAGAGSPQKFFAGFDTGWYAIEAELDVRRRLIDDVLSEQIAGVGTAASPRLIIIKAHAGAGKTVALRRLAWEAAKKHEKLVFFVSSRGSVNTDMIAEVVSLTSLPIFLFVDDVSDHLRALEPLLGAARRHKWPLVIVGAERVNEWNMFCEPLEYYVGHVYEIGYLSEREIDDLLTKLEQHNCLGRLSNLPAEDRKKQLQTRYGRQLLVALHEATHGVPFREIVRDEYEGIVPVEARILYLDICSLHRFGPPVRAGLISRVHEIDFDRFREEFFEPLEKVVELRFDPRSGDYVYQARHAHIADILYNEALHDEGERFDNIMRIVSKLNPGYSYDRDVIGQIVRAENISTVFPDHRKADAIYDAVLQRLGPVPFLLHQRGIYEMKRAGDAAGLDQAETYLAEAQEADPRNRSIKHSLAELALSRSRLASSELERESWRERAAAQAGELTSGETSSHPFHTLLKAAVDRVRDALSKVEQADHELNRRALDDAIRRCDEILRRGLQRFPNDGHLLAEEATLSQILLNADRALAALEKAFMANPQSELIARRLARIYRAKGRIGDAISTLNKTLDFNPGNYNLHYDVAIALMEEYPNADTDRADLLLWHLKRSFVSGDKKYQARFWFARQLCLCSQYEEASKVFRVLRDVPLPYGTKADVKGIVRDNTGAPRMFVGQISVLRNTFGFIRCDQPLLDAYFVPGDSDGEERRFRERQRVCFEIGFNLFGPRALNVQKLLL